MAHQMTRQHSRFLTLIFCFVTCLLVACQPLQPVTPPTATIATQPTATAAAAAPVPSVTLDLSGFTQRIHDPVMAEEDGTYYVFSTGSRIIMICSEDMIAWEWCGRVFERTPSWVAAAIPGVRDLWAPDISYFNGKWHLYYAGSIFGTNQSVIGLATNVTLDPDNPNYAWVDEGEVISSQPGDSWNTIDANLTFDQDGEPWLAFGSYWTGIKLRKIDPDTGKLATDDDATLYALAQRFTNNGAVEAPFIVVRNGYYYLFVSFDSCCQGADSTYNVRVGRATAITGPYIDREGIRMLEGGGTQILAAYDRWRGPGHNGIYIEDDTYWMVYHAYDAKEVGIPKLRIESLGWDEEGWPYLASQQN